MNNLLIKILYNFYNISFKLPFFVKLSFFLFFLVSFFLKLVSFTIEFLQFPFFDSLFCWCAPRLGDSYPLQDTHLDTLFEGENQINSLIIEEEAKLLSQNGLNFEEFIYFTQNVQYDPKVLSLISESFEQMVSQIDSARDHFVTSNDIFEFSSDDILNSKTGLRLQELPNNLIRDTTDSSECVEPGTSTLRRNPIFSSEFLEIAPHSSIQSENELTVDVLESQNPFLPSIVNPSCVGLNVYLERITKAFDQEQKKKHPSLSTLLKLIRQQSQEKRVTVYIEGIGEVDITPYIPYIVTTLNSRKNGVTLKRGTELARWIALQSVINKIMRKK